MAANNIPFATPFDRPASVPTHSGNQFEDVSQLDFEGGAHLASTGKKDIYAFVQSFKDDQTMDAVLARVRAGDYRDFRSDGSYGDIRFMPHSLAEAYELGDRSRLFYDSLPADVKKEYPEFSDFLAVLSSPEDFKKFSEMFAPAPISADTTPEGGENV